MDIDNIAIEADGDLIFITVAKYKLFLSYGKIGLDAYMLYSHLIFTARLQKTNNINAKDIYLQNGLGWGKMKLYKAKNLLYDLGIIKKLTRRDSKGHFCGSYIIVQTKTAPFEVNEPAGPETGGRLTGRPATAHKCLNEEVKCLNEKENTANIKKITQNTTTTIYNCQYFTIFSDKHKEYSDIYKFDLLKEYKKMKIWLDDNPKKRKKDYPRFISNWLNTKDKEFKEKEADHDIIKKLYPNKEL